MDSQEIILERGQNEIRVVFDEPVYERGVKEKTTDFDLEVSPMGAGQCLHITSDTADPRDGFCGAGSFIQRFAPYPLDALSYAGSRCPEISCIILLTFNCHFVQNFLIPSIVANTTLPYEIIIVYNGAATDLSLFERFNLIQSETGCVSKAYNTGVAAAKGRYIALFHDDCMVTSPGWHQPMIAAIDRGAFATSTESLYNPHFALEYLKGSPLLMPKANYEFIGGHDEFYFAGIEDLDFSYRIQLQGYTVKKVTIPYRHFRGMSTVILLSGRAEEVRTLFGYCVIPESAIEKWKARYMGSSETQAMIQAVNRENLQYFRMKWSMSAHGDTVMNRESLNPGTYPALSNIRTTYQQWLLKQFSIG